MTKMMEIMKKIAKERMKRLKTMQKVYIFVSVKVKLKRNGLL